MAKVTTGEPGRIIGKTVEVEGRRKNGEVFPVELSVATWIGEDGRRFSGILRDITDRKQTEEALRESEARFVLVNQATRDFLFDWDFKTDKVHFPIDKRVEFKQVGWDGSGVGWEERVHPDDREKFREHFIASLKGEVERISVEYRHGNDDGDWRWIHSKGIALRDRDGRASRLVGSMVDITERKQAEAEVLAAKNAASAARAQMIDAIESTSEGFSLYDPEGRLILSNSAFRTMYGYSEADLANRPTVSRLVALDVERGVLTERAGGVDVRRQREAHFGSGTASLDLRFNDGRWVQIRDRRTSDGGTVSVHTDITERKHAYEELEEKEAQLRILLDNFPAAVRYVDKERRFVLVNAKYHELYDVPEDLVKVGNSVRGEHLYLAKRGDYGEGDPETLVSAVMNERPYDTEPLHYERTTRAGRVIEIFTQPVSIGGFVSVYTDITERRQAEEELATAKHEVERNADLLNSIFESVDQGISVIDPDQQVIRANARWAELLDLPGAYVADPPHLREVFRMQLERGEHQHLGANFEERLAILLAPRNQAQGVVSEERETQNGRVLEIRTNPMPAGGAVRTFTDITERKQAEAEILASKNAANAARVRMIDAIENTSEGLSIYDPEGRLILCNSAFRKLYGYSEADLEHQPNVLELLALDIDRGTVAGEEGGVDVTRRREEQFGRGEETLYLPLLDGRWVQIRDRKTSNGGTVSIHTDITERKRTEEALEIAKHEADAANREKSAFLASMSHEIRTPLSGITGFLELLQYGELDQDQRRMVQSANLAARALIDLIGDVLDFSKIEAGHLDLTPDLVSPRLMLAETLAVVMPRAREKLVELLGQVAPDVPDHIHADPVRLRQILANLVGNAVKFTETGAVHIELMVSRDPDDGAARLRFEVTDTGIGFDLETTSDLFAEFRQADDTTTRRFGGTGLGLTICKRLIDLMGGEIGYHGEEGRGALFWFDLPIAEAKAPEDTSTDQAGLKILLHGGKEVDPEIVEILSTSGAQVHLRRETSGSEKASSPDEPYDALVMSDDGSDGDIDTVRDASDTRILISFETGFQLKQRALRAGFTHVIARDRCAATLMFQIAEARWLSRASRDTQSSNSMPVEIKTILDPEIADLPILVIDDIEMNRDIAGRQLQKLGLRHETAIDGRDGLAAATSRPYAAALVDIQMPVMDGFEFTRGLRDWENRQGAALARRLPVIALTANVTTGDADKCIAAGMDDYLSKPLAFGRLSDMLRRYLGARDNHGDGDRGTGMLSSDNGRPLVELPTSVLSDAPVDRDELREIYGVIENEELLGIIGDFFSNYEDLRQRLDRAIVSQDREELRDVAHAAKGTSGYISANRLGGLFAAMEETASTAAWDQVQESVKLVEDELMRVQVFVEMLEREA